MLLNTCVAKNFPDLLMTEVEMSILGLVTLIYKNKKWTRLLVQEDKVRGLIWVSHCARWFLQVLLFWHKINAVPKYFSPDICAENLTSKFLHLVAKVIYLSPLFSLAASLCTSAQPFSWLAVLSASQLFLDCFFSVLWFFLFLWVFSLFNTFFFFLRWSKAIIIYLWICSR